MNGKMCLSRSIVVGLLSYHLTVDFQSHCKLVQCVIKREGGSMLGFVKLIYLLLYILNNSRWIQHVIKFIANTICGDSLWMERDWMFTISCFRWMKLNLLWSCVILALPALLWTMTSHHILWVVSTEHQKSVSWVHYTVKSVVVVQVLGWQCYFHQG